MSFFVDFQYFNNEDDYIIKELAILNSQIGLSHYVFRPPFSISKLSQKDKKQAKWLQYNYHNLSWQDGFLPYTQLPWILKHDLKNATIIYVKGIEKKIYLEKQSFKNVINIEDLNFKYKIRKHCNQGLMCIWHYQKTGICSLRNVFYMRKRMVNFDY